MELHKKQFPIWITMEKSLVKWVTYSGPISPPSSSKG